MVAAQAVAGEDSLLNTLLGFGAVALLVAVLGALQMRRWWDPGLALRLRGLIRRDRSRRSPAASSVRDVVKFPQSPGVATAIESPRPAMSSSSRVGETPAQPADKMSPSRPPRGEAPAPASTRSGATTSALPRGLPGARYSPETLEPLARRVEDSRRIAVADARVRDALAALPHDRWLVERYALISGHRVPFLLLGEAGVLTLWPVETGPSWGDMEFTNDVAKVIEKLLPAYPAPVRVGFCRAFERGMPRWWSQGGAGAWIMGLDGIRPWLQHFGPEHGLGAEDVSRFNALAGPHWGRRRSPARFRVTPDRG
jgi:hypothetical protein